MKNLTKTNSTEVDNVYMESLKVGSQVAKKAGRGEYWRGKVTKVKGSKALVNFPTRGLSRWCNKSNLDLITR